MGGVAEEGGAAAGPGVQGGHVVERPVAHGGRVDFVDECGDVWVPVFDDVKDYLLHGFAGHFWCCVSCVVVEGRERGGGAFLVFLRVVVGDEEGTV